MVWAWLRMVMMVAVVLLPGGFPLLLAYVALRTLRSSWRRAQEEAQTGAAWCHSGTSSPRSTSRSWSARHAPRSERGWNRSTLPGLELRRP